MMIFVPTFTTPLFGIEGDALYHKAIRYTAFLARAH